MDFRRAMNLRPAPEAISWASRPKAPDASLLRTAADVLARRLETGVESGRAGRWKVLRRLERPRSTVFLLEAETSRGPVRAFYKTAHAPHRDEVASAAAEPRHRRALEVAARLGPKVARALQQEPIRIDEPLVISPEQMTSICLAVPGRPLGKSVTWGVPGRRERGLRIYRLLGRGIRLIEDVSRANEGEVEQPTGRRYLDAKLVRAFKACAKLGILRRPEEIREAAFALLERVTARSAPILVHGDMSQSNVLVHGHTMGIIDFSWMPRLPGNDVVHLLARIEAERPQWPRWTALVIEELCAGYGADPHDVPEHWKLMRLVRQLGLAGNPRVSARQRAVAELRVADMIRSMG